MLRRLIGDEAFFNGLRSVLSRVAVQEGRHGRLPGGLRGQLDTLKLERFFERWIRGSSVPRLRLSYQAEPTGESAAIRVEQVGEVFDLPLTVTVQYTDGRTDEVTVKITEPRRSRHGSRSKAVVRRVVAKDELSLYEIVK